ncbi:MAG TPA: hypothetical protein VFI79_06515 [Gemmatimonadales bacterium]|nr:hypothetical protein [Gemmatimonadales bacterium]
MIPGTAVSDDPTPGSQLDGWAGRLLLLLAAVLVTGGAGEVAVRWILGDQMVLYPRYHSQAVYGAYTLRRLRPNTVFWHTSRDGHWRFVTNAAGFRNDRDVPYAKPPGRLRVLSLGDSNTEGFEVRQSSTFSAVIEQWLNLHGAPADVLNAGVSGFGTAEALAFLENEGINYHPDVVVYGLYANDFDDNVRSGLFALDHDSLAVTSTVYAPAAKLLDVLNAIAPLRWLSEHSYLYSLAFNTGWTWFKRADIHRVRNDSLNEYTQPQGTPNQDERSLMAALLSRMSQFCRTRGILFVVIDIPDYVDHDAGAFTTSIPPSLLEDARRDADVLLSSHDVLDPYAGIAKIHVEHGQHHISEFSHLMLGLRAAQAILAKRGACGAAPVRLQLCVGRSPAMATAP